MRGVGLGGDGGPARRALRTGAGCADGERRRAIGERGAGRRDRQPAVAQPLLRDLPQRPSRNRRPQPAGNRHVARRRGRRDLGKGDPEAAHRHHAAVQPAAAARRGAAGHARVAGDIARRRVGDESEPRPDGDAPAPQPHGISELDPRPARAGHRCHGAAPSGRERVRLRQRDGRQPLAGAARPLHLRGAQDQPAGRWRAAGVRRERRDPRAPGHHAGSARAGAADRHPGRRGRVAHLPAGRTVRHSGAPRPQSQRQHRRPARSAVARAAVPAGPDADSELHDRAAGR